MMVTDKPKVRCGNHNGRKEYHDDTAQVRMCYQGRLEAYLGAARPVVDTEAAAEDFLSGCSGRNPLGYKGPEATDPQKRYIASLLVKQEIPGREAEGIRNRILGGMPKSEAHRTIEALLKLPERSTPAPARPTSSNDPELATVRVAPWNRLRTAAESLPDGNYAIDVPGDKAHFYRIARGRNGFVKVQERASEVLYPVTGVDRCINIVQAILAAGVKESGMLYSTKLKRCYRCGLKLTDENNPYYAYGLGPDCGAK